MIIGVGNPDAGDDAAGPMVARRLGGRETGGDVTELLELWSSADEVILVDAVRSGSPAGTIHRFDAGAGPLPERSFRGSTHALGVGDAIELARALGRLPRKLVVYGIEGRTFAPGEPMSPEVAAAVEELCTNIISCSA